MRKLIILLMLLSFCGGSDESAQESSPVITTNEKPVLENQENTENSKVSAGNSKEILTTI